ncbi:MAG TPA: hypothetical protein VGQ69_14995 [Gemmatimonadales bacterium]|nr:hypothetical protein [Gemmatimonadales bacterium]
MSKSLASATLLLAVLAGCGGGSDGAAQNAPAAAAAGLEEESTAPAGATTTAAVSAKPKIDPSLIPEPGAPLVRETYSYLGGSRDPFASVLEGALIGPELADLDVAAVYYQERDQAQSVAVLRDRTNGKRYTVREGERVGRARVVGIRPKDVSFTIDDYGTQRRVTLSLRKREDTTP